MVFDRRTWILTAAGLGVAGAGTVTAASARPRAPTGQTWGGGPFVGLAGMATGSGQDVTAVLQAAIDRAAAAGAPVILPPGRYRTGPLRLPSNTRLSGAGAGTILVSTGSGALVTAEDASGIALENFAIDGKAQAATASGLIALRGCDTVDLYGLILADGPGHGIVLEACSGRIERARVSGMGQSGIFALDSSGLDIAGNAISDCANNGIQVWRSSPGIDGTTVTGNRIERIAAASGGTGENGNGINLFRAGEVLVSGNRITDCAFSAIRANAASNVQMLGNSCARLGEVALYAEFAFDGAVISGNLVETAASGISVTNFDVGGRLAVVSGNLIRNVRRREFEPVDTRGEGITVEADCVVSGNTIESAETAGIVVGTGAYLRDVSVSGNVIRAAATGILVSGEAGPGTALIVHNLISGAAAGAIRLSRGGRADGPELVATTGSVGAVTLAGNVAS